MQDVTALLHKVNDMVETYTQKYADYIESIRSSTDSQSNDLGVREVMLSLMGDSDKLNELTSLVSKLRFAAESKDQQKMKEAEEEIEMISRFLPEDLRVNKLINAVKTPTNAGTKLAELYLQRCYYLSNKQISNIQTINEEIQALESPEEI